MVIWMDIGDAGAELVRGDWGRHRLVVSLS